MLYHTWCLVLEIQSGQGRHGSCSLGSFAESSSMKDHSQSQNKQQQQLALFGNEGFARAHIGSWKQLISLFPFPPSSLKAMIFSLLFQELNVEYYMAGQFLVCVSVMNHWPFNQTTTSGWGCVNQRQVCQIALCVTNHILSVGIWAFQIIFAKHLFISKFPNVCISCWSEKFRFQGSRIGCFPYPFCTYFTPLSLGLWHLEKDLLVTIQLQIGHSLVSVFENVWQSLQCLIWLCRDCQNP